MSEHHQVVVIGAGISGLTLGYRLHSQGREVLVLEAGARPGGTTKTESIEGFHVDHGSNGFLTNVEHGYELASEIGLELRSASDHAQERFIYRDQKLHPAPLGALTFASSQLMSLKARLRVGFEPFAAKAPLHRDETVYEFAERRLGRGFAESIIRPMVLGITAGDARRISLKALFPRMWAMEREHGGLVKAMIERPIQRALGKREQNYKAGGPTGPGGRLTTAKGGGIGALTEALANKLGDKLRLNSQVQELARVEQRWRVSTQDQAFTADKVVLAIPAYAAAELTEGLDPVLGEQLRQISYAGVRVLALGFHKRDLAQVPEGFGFLVSPDEGLQILGCLWTSSVYPWQAPADQILMRIMLGGSLEPELVGLDEAAVEAIVLKALAQSMGIKAQPSMKAHFAWERGIPQYQVGHLHRVEQIEAAAGQLGLHLLGNAYRGIGLNDCVREATALAAKL